METTPNAAAIEAWNTIQFDRLVRFREIAAQALAAHGDGAIARLPSSPGLRVIDLGCGFGDTTRELGRRVGSRGHVVGVDAAPRYIDVARRETAGIESVRYRVADVQVEALEGPFDVAFSRMGTMFFAEPVVAMRNVARALVPEGLLSILVWRHKHANPCFALPEAIVKDVLGIAPDPSEAGATGPGPFSMADCDRVSDQLDDAGFGEITFRRHDAELRLGRDIEQAVAVAMTLGPAGEQLRKSGALAEARHAEVVLALTAGLAPYTTSDGVRLTSSTWHITAIKR